MEAERITGNASWIGAEGGSFPWRATAGAQAAAGRFVESSSNSVDGPVTRVQVRPASQTEW
jgi:hypothetical protein